MRTRCVVAALLLSVAHAAQAQDDVPDPRYVRVKIGALWLNPTIALTNVGVDQNVFNDPVERAPKSDFTLTLSPASEVWLRVGPTWVTGKVSEQILWFQKYASERSVTNLYTIGYRVPLSRVSIKADAQLNSARDRPGYEIDARADRRELTVDIGGELRALSKTYLAVEARRFRTDFKNNQFFLGADLRETLNRSGTAYSVAVRHQLTPLTSISFTGTRAEDRFEFEPQRNTRATSGTVGVIFDRFALIKGSASFGYTDFRPLDDTVPAYRGTTAALNLSYAFAGTTRIGVKADRGVQYSYDVDQPYYLQTGFDVSLAQQLFGPVDAVVHGGLEHLDYRTRALTVLDVENRLDRAASYGFGVGYHIGRDLRLGVNADRTMRTSDIRLHTYDDWRIGSSLTYGF